MHTCRVSTTVCLYIYIHIYIYMWKTSMTDKYCSTVPPFHPFFRTVTTQDLGDCLQDHVAHFHLDGPWAVTGFYHTIPMSNPSKGHFKTATARDCELSDKGSTRFRKCTVVRFQNSSKIRRLNGFPLASAEDTVSSRTSG